RCATGLTGQASRSGQGRQGTFNQRVQLGSGGRANRTGLRAGDRTQRHHPRRNVMLTVDFDRLDIGPSATVIDVGCGAGRRAFEAYRRGANVVAFDRDESELRSVEGTLRAMAEAGEAPLAASANVVLGDALNLPYANETFDCVIASEILEHIPHDTA